MLGRHRAGGNRQEARQPRFRRQRVVVRGVEAAVGDVEADGEQLPLPVEQEIELRFLDQIVGEDAEPFGALDQARGVVAGPRDGVTPAPGLRALQEVITPRHQGGETRNAAGAAAHHPRRSSRSRARAARDRPAGRQRRPPRGPASTRLQPRRGDGTSREQRLLDFVQQHADRRQPIANLRQQPRFQPDSVSGRSASAARRLRSSFLKAASRLLAVRSPRTPAPSPPRRRSTTSSRPSRNDRVDERRAVGQLRSPARSVTR